MNATATIAKLSPRRGRRVRKAAPLAGSVHRVTAKGVKLRLDLYHNIDDGVNEGWQVDLVEAHSEQGPVGYLKLSYIPAAEMKRLYPSPLAWAVRRKSLFAGLEPLMGTPSAKWDRDQLNQALAATDGWRPDNTHLEQRALLTLEQLRQQWAKLEDRYNQEHAAAFRDFRLFHMDRPLVDYICVYKGNSPRHYIGSQHIDVERSNCDFQRQGIGTVLYQTGALWLHAQGLKMHASGIQSKMAGGAWATFKDQGLTCVSRSGSKTRTVFDAQALLDQSPQLAEGLLVL